MPDLDVAPSPHLVDRPVTTRMVMIHVLVGLAPPLTAAIYFFRHHAVKQIVIATAACVCFEWLFERLRGRRANLQDCSALVTGAILALSLPWSAPWYVPVIAGMIAMGIGKAVFGGLGQNLFNPAMAGRAFVMIAFSSALGAGGYIDTDSALRVVTSATPLSTGDITTVPGIGFLFWGFRNGSLGETSIIAVLLGGGYLLIRRVAAWEIPLATILAVAAMAVFGQLLDQWLKIPNDQFVRLQLGIDQHLFTGAVLFGAFFIATDPVTSPMTRTGRIIFGLGLGIMVWAIRCFSNYPEGLMFAVLFMNGLVPLINRWTIPRPVGWRPPVAPPAAQGAKP